MSNTQVALFQHDTGAGPSQKFGALTQAGLANDLGDGIRSSYAILSIKAGRWRIKYKGNETPIQAFNPQTQRNEPVPTLEMVIVKANPFLNKQFYNGKYVEGSNSAPDCYSLDGKVPSAQVAKPQFANCTLCPKNQWGSLISESGVKQKACRDTKKLAVVPLGDIRNAALGGAMLFRVPPSSLKDLSTMADALKARGYPYNSVAVRFGFDLDASHPKPTFQGIRPLTDDEADAVLEMFESDSVAAVLADNDVVTEVGHAPVAGGPGSFEQEPVVPVGPQVTAAPVVAAAPQPQAPPPPPVAAVPAPVVQAAPEPVQSGPTVFAAAAVAPPPPGMHGAVVQPFRPGAAPSVDATMAALSAFGQPAAPAPAPVPQAAPQAPAAPKPRKPKPVVEQPAPTVVEPTQEPQGAQLEADIGNILAGLSAFTGGK